MYAKSAKYECHTKSQSLKVKKKVFATSLTAPDDTKAPMTFPGDILEVSAPFCISTAKSPVQLMWDSPNAMFTFPKITIFMGEIRDSNHPQMVYGIGFRTLGC